MGGRTGHAPRGCARELTRASSLRMGIGSTPRRPTRRRADPNPRMNRTGAASFSESILPGASPGRACLRRALLFVALFFVAGSYPALLRDSAAAAFPQVFQSTPTPFQREIEKQRARLSSGDVEERREAVTRLGAMARADSSRVALPALNDAAAIGRPTAARAVLSLPAGEAAAVLLPLLADKDEFVRREAAYALGLT